MAKHRAHSLKLLSYISLIGWKTNLGEIPFIVVISLNSQHNTNLLLLYKTLKRQLTKSWIHSTYIFSCWLVSLVRKRLNCDTKGWNSTQCTEVNNLESRHIVDITEIYCSTNFGFKQHNVQVPKIQLSCINEGYSVLKVQSTKDSVINLWRTFFQPLTTDANKI